MKTEFFPQKNGSRLFLTAEQEVELFKQMEKGDKSARDKIIMANLWSVVFIAKNFKNSALPLADLIQAGTIGLIKAAGKFDFRRGFRFSTYAASWIRQTIRAELANERTIRLPAHILAQRSRVMQESWQLYQILCRPPADAEIASRLGWAVEKVRAAKEAAAEPASLDAPAGAEEDLTLMDVTGNTMTIDPVERAQAAFLRENINAVLLATLNRLELEVVNMRYGLNGGSPLTLEKCRSRLKVSRERVRQIELQALTRLRRSSLTQKLKDYL
jgi:RNA polymerase primary sigma factor